MASAMETQCVRDQFRYRCCPHVVWQDDGDIDAADIDGNDDIYYRGSAIDVNGNCIWGGNFGEH